VQFIANCAEHNLHVGELLVLRGNSLMPDMDGMEVVVHASAPAVIVAPALHPARLAAIKEVSKTAQLDLFEQAA